MTDASSQTIWFRPGLWVFFALSVAMALLAAVVCMRWFICGIRTLRQATRHQAGQDTDRPDEPS